MSEGKPSRQLYVPWRRDTAIPGSESATSDVGAKYGRTSSEVAPRLEGVPIPDNEQPRRKRRGILKQRELMS
jgi:hypothetical protein